MAQLRILSALLLVSFLSSTVSAYTFQLPKFLGGGGGSPSKVFGSQKSNINVQKAAILEAVSFTNNGKTATEEQQSDVLRKVRQLETEQPPRSLDDPEFAKLLDGTWYLHYTSPSIVGDADEFPDSWKPASAAEGDSNIETRQFNAQGSISAGGVTVDTSNKVVKQIYDVANGQVFNEVNLDWGQVVVSGAFRQSPNIPNRAIISFDTVLLRLGDGDNPITLNLGFLFSVLAIVRGSGDNGWLETTFLDDEMRIGRGNKGTMFVLTRDPEDVKP